jgi:hypothetical protein
MDSVQALRVSRDQSSFASSPRLFADFHALLSLLTPRHPPCALWWFDHRNLELALLSPASRHCKAATKPGDRITFPMLHHFFLPPKNNEHSFLSLHQSSPCEPPLRMKIHRVHHKLRILALLVLPTFWYHSSARNASHPASIDALKKKNAHHLTAAQTQRILYGASKLARGNDSNVFQDAIYRTTNLPKINCLTRSKAARRSSSHLIPRWVIIWPLNISTLQGS